MVTIVLESVPRCPGQVGRAGQTASWATMPSVRLTLDPIALTSSRARDADQPRLDSTDRSLIVKIRACRRPLGPAHAATG